MVFLSDKKDVSYNYMALPGGVAELADASDSKSDADRDIEFRSQKFRR